MDVTGQAMFNSMDTDHDDVIAYSEFLAAALQEGPQIQTAVKTSKHPVASGLRKGIVLMVFDGGIIHTVTGKMVRLECEKE